MKQIHYHYHRLQFHQDRYLPTRIYLFGGEPIFRLNPFQAVRSGHIKKNHTPFYCDRNLDVRSQPSCHHRPGMLLFSSFSYVITSSPSSSSSSFLLLLYHLLFFLPLPPPSSSTVIFLPLQVFGTVQCYQSICTGLTGSVRYPSSRLQFLITNYPEIKRQQLKILRQ